MDEMIKQKILALLDENRSGPSAGMRRSAGHRVGMFNHHWRDFPAPSPTGRSLCHAAQNERHFRL